MRDLADTLPSENELRELAREVLRLSRSTLLVNLRFLDAALSRFTHIAADKASLATDGRRLVYGPRHVLRGYRADRAVPVRDYLHVVLHCVFRHMFVGAEIDRALWDLACDAAVEAAITELGLRATAAARETRQAETVKTLRRAVGQLTAEKLYRHFLENRPAPAELAALGELFRADDHRVWYLDEAERARELAPAEPEGEQGAESADRSEGLGTEADWKEISQRMQMDMEAFGRRRGDLRGALMQNLRAVNRERYDYSDFLRRFAVRGEVMRLSDEEFDYVYYSYGLRLYKNLPLVEPLEYREVRRIREFVIAIDTSASVSGRLVQRFVQKTYNVLKSTESFFSKICLHVLQCDAEVQEDVKITSQADFDEYLRSMRIKGLGGTDFRPVFRRVDELIAAGEFENLKGLIYFTDGKGVYPANKPDYDAAFVFVDADYDPPEVPSWAIRLVLDAEEI